MNRTSSRLAFLAKCLALIVCIASISFVAMVLTPPRGAAIAASDTPPLPLLGLAHQATLGEIAPTALVSMGLSPEGVPSLLAAIASSQSSFFIAALARHEHALATAADAQARAAIRAGGLTPERSAALAAAETREPATAARRSDPGGRVSFWDDGRIGPKRQKQIEADGGSCGTT